MPKEKTIDAKDVGKHVDKIGDDADSASTAIGKITKMQSDLAKLAKSKDVDAKELEAKLRDMQRQIDMLTKVVDSLNKASEQIAKNL